MRNRQSTPDTKSQHSQPTKERETQRTTAQEDALVTQQDPLVQTISRMGSPPSAKVHANLLSRATSDYPARGRQLMLQMQRQYGNRYVQRVVELSRQGPRETEATPEVEAAIEQTRGGGDRSMLASSGKWNPLLAPISVGCASIPTARLMLSINPSVLVPSLQDKTSFSAKGNTIPVVPVARNY